ncbi:hypothetical protein KCU97_g33, partial [Aureobasidium melanogenum]
MSAYNFSLISSCSLLGSLTSLDNHHNHGCTLRGSVELRGGGHLVGGQLLRSLALLGVLLSRLFDDPRTKAISSALMQKAKKHSLLLESGASSDAGHEDDGTSKHARGSGGGLGGRHVCVLFFLGWSVCGTSERSWLMRCGWCGCVTAFEDDGVVDRDGKLVAGRMKLGSDIRVATFHSALAPTPCSFTIHPRDAGSVEVHLNALNLEDIVLFWRSTTPASTICPVVPARSELRHALQPIKPVLVKASAHDF